MSAIARSLVVTLVIASGFAVAGVSIGDLAVSAGAAPTLALVAAAALAAAALVAAVGIVARTAAAAPPAVQALRRRAVRHTPVLAPAAVPHVLPSPRAPSGVLPATD